MTDTCCDMTHRAYELALGEGLGFWESSTTVTPFPSVSSPRSGLRARFGGGSRRQRSAALMLHVFDGGLVVERQKGGVLGAAYDAVSATLLDITEAANGPSSALSLTFDGSRTLLLLQAADRSTDALGDLGARCGASTKARVSRPDAEQAFGEPDWI